jgi:hypothetical protein
MSRPSASTALAVLRAEDFEPLIGERFALQLDDRSVELRLELAEPFGSARPDLDRPPFALVFAAPMKGPLPQQTYPLEHAELGRLELFLVPISASDGECRYEAVFS